MCDSPSDEPLVRVAHRRIRTIPVYWHAGWDSAVPDLWMRVGVADALGQAADSLPDRFGFAVLDAWRSLELQQAIYDAAYSDSALPAGFVSSPSSDPLTPPPHLTGGTVDVALTFDGWPLQLGTGFDDFSADAHTDAWEHRGHHGADVTVRELRRMQFWALAKAGFVTITCEWWHAELGTRRWAAITGGDALYGPAGPD